MKENSENMVGHGNKESKAHSFIILKNRLSNKQKLIREQANQIIIRLNDSQWILIGFHAHLLLAESFQ